MIIDKHMPVLSKCPLFAGIKPENLEALLGCLSVRSKTYSKGSFIINAGDKLKDMGIVLSGSAHVLREDYWGGRQILSNLTPGELFAESFIYAGLPTMPVSVQVNEKSEVLFINGSKLIHSCTNSCNFHAMLIGNMMKILAAKNVLLTRKIEHVTCRSIREKTLSYLSSQAMSKGANSFEIPFNRQELADYLATDRSALSSELSKMQAEGLISFHKNRFTIH